MHQLDGIPPRATTRLATSRTLPLETHDLGTFDDLVDLVSGGGVVVLSGAGLSTESGIPDYRGPDGTRRVEPMTYGEFAGSSEARRRYWARSYIGWQRFNAAEPNEGHRVVTRAAAQRLRRAGHHAERRRAAPGVGRPRRRRAARLARTRRLPHVR